MKNKEIAAQVLMAEFNWLDQFIQQRLADYFQPPREQRNLLDTIPPPKLPTEETAYGKLVQSLSAWLTAQEVNKQSNAQRELNAHRLVIALALSPHFRPEVLDLFYTKNSQLERPFTEFGGSRESKSPGFIPTGETALFLACGADLSGKIEMRNVFSNDHFFYEKNVLQLSEVKGAGESFLSGALTISTELLYSLTSDRAYEPTYNSSFPAKRIRTKLTDKDLVLAPYQRQMVEEVFVWIKHEAAIFNEWKLDKIFRPGFRALFYGPPGTGKTFCATVLGQRAERPVYRIDLSQIVSKYIGETEKNLARLFDQAEHRNWILFFDEADALFGKRTATTNANDRYANQEVAYLLQRIEDFNGLIILASNLKGNIDEAFARRFQTMIYFPLPGPDERLKIWENTLGQIPELVAEENTQAESAAGPPQLFRSSEISAALFAREYELAGGNIVNAVRSATMSALRRAKKQAEEYCKEKDYVILVDDVVFGVRTELKKMGKNP